MKRNIPSLAPILSSPLRSLGGLFVAAVMIQSSVQGAVIFADNFDGTTLNPSNFAGKGDVWSTSGTGTGKTASVAGNQLVITRTAAAAAGDSLAIAGMANMATFSTATAGQQKLSIDYSLQVNSFLAGSGTGNNAIRMGLYNSTTTDRLFLGFGAVDINGVATNAFYITTSLTALATASNVLGYNTTTQTWTAGFDFGTYDTSVAANNHTGIMSVDISYIDQSTNGTITLTASNGNTASLSLGLAPTTWTNTSSMSNSYRFYNPNSGDSSYTIDNLSASVVPEPNTSGLIFGAGLVLMIGYRRSQRWKLAAR